MGGIEYPFPSAAAGHKGNQKGHHGTDLKDDENIYPTANLEYVGEELPHTVDFFFSFWYIIGRA
jgi:hypothetical protein